MIVSLKDRDGLNCFSNSRSVLDKSRGKKGRGEKSEEKKGFLSAPFKTAVEKKTGTNFKCVVF